MREGGSRTQMMRQQQAASSGRNRPQYSPKAIQCAHAIARRTKASTLLIGSEQNTLTASSRRCMRMVSTTLDMMMTSSKSASRPLLMAANLW